MPDTTRLRNSGSILPTGTLAKRLLRPVQPLGLNVPAARRGAGSAVLPPRLLPGGAPGRLVRLSPFGQLFRQQLAGEKTIQTLMPAVLAFDHDAARPMHKLHARRHLVHVLPAVPARVNERFLQIRLPHPQRPQPLADCGDAPGTDGRLAHARSVGQRSAARNGRLRPARFAPITRPMQPRLLGLALGALLLAGCRAPQPQTTAFLPEKLAALDAAIEQAIADRKCPGGVLWLERDGHCYHRAYGQRALIPTPEPMTGDTIFDAASLTKVVACAPAILRLVELGKIALDDPVARHLPEFTGDGRDAITLRQLLTHTSGLPPGISGTGWHGRQGAINKAATVKLDAPPGAAFKYSDINFFLLGEIVQRASAIPLEEFVQREFYRPLKMTDTGYLPPAAKLPRVAPTEIEGTNPPLRAIVHDPTARQMGGVAGHAGLFTTAADLARFARMLLNEGELDGVRVLRPETVRLMTSVQTPPTLTAKRGLGWDMDSSYSGPRGEIFPVGSFGHTGWTGTSIWIDPASRTFVIFLSNRNHPTKDGNVQPLRRQIGTLAAEAVGLTRPAAPPPNPPAATPALSPRFQLDPNGSLVRPRRRRRTSAPCRRCALAG